MIGTYDYRLATDTIAEAIELGADCLSGLLCMREHLQDANINDLNRFKTQLNAYIEATYGFIVAKNLTYNNPMTGAVRAINQHVLDEYGNDSLDEFLENQYLEVPATFASISNFIGYEVTLIGSDAARYQDIDAYWEDVDNLTWDRIGWTNINE